VHEIGHILGLNHPDKMSTVAGYPVGNNSYHAYLASNDGMEPFSKPGFPADVCSNPWAHVRSGVWPGAKDIDAASGLRSSVMLSFTAQNPKACQQPRRVYGFWATVRVGLYTPYQHHTTKTLPYPGRLAG
jgi:hypothetical protein